MCVRAGPLSWKTVSCCRLHPGHSLAIVRIQSRMETTAQTLACLVLLALAGFAGEEASGQPGGFESLGDGGSVGTSPNPEDHGAKPASVPNPFDIQRRRREHWAWQPVRSYIPAMVQNQSWCQQPLDRFILCRLESEGLRSAEPSDKRTLIRRASFDLIGLPPTPSQVAEFVADESPEAFARVVDRLLSSPRFGERWARHWLDLVRYAETRGHEFDPIIPNAHQYRDYVIRTLNGDVPYDQFVMEHVAGDLISPPRLDRSRGFSESVLGTGFWFLGEEVHSPVDIRGDETDRIDNKLDVFSKTFLGLTVSCARCHDHKFDAISMGDYYSLAGYLLSSSYRQVAFESTEQNREVAVALQGLQDRGRPVIARALADAYRPAILQFHKYLLASCAALQAESAAVSGKVPTPGTIESIAKQLELDSTRLNHWVAQVRQASQDAHHPLHIWATGVAETTIGHKTVEASLRRFVADAQTREQQAAESRNQLRVIVDYAKPRDDDWLQDGFSFGMRPVRAGEIRLGTNPARPVAEVFSIASAWTDQSRSEIRLAPDTETDPGKVAWLQAGRMLRTRKFTLSSGRLFYLVRGSGQAYAAVDSHRMISGPLHGALVRAFDAPSAGQWHWVEHNLSDYKGHRVHVEFSAKEARPDQDPETTELAIVMVVESERPPPEPPHPATSFGQQLAASAAGSLDSLAQAYERVFLEAINDFANDRIIGSPDATQTAWLVNWICRNPELVVSPGAVDSKLADTAGPLLESQAQLISRMVRTSHTAPALLDGNGVEEFVLKRGNHRTPAEPAPRRFLEAIDGRAGSAPPSGSGRLELARRMTDPSNPFVARVLVNRVWHHLFGRGIVTSVDNFGVLGERPTHPELLDFLATQFIEQGWSIKWLIRSVMLSSTYQMSARVDEQAERVDPGNQWLHHREIRRLEGESIRDAILSISGGLNGTLYGPSVEVYLTPFMEGRGRPGSSGPLDGDGRRSIYLRTRRNFPHPMLCAFDTPTPFTTFGRRSVSNVPAQALALMNSSFVVEQARRWAIRVLREPDSSDRERVTRMYLEAFARPPSAEELDDAIAFIQLQREQYRDADQDVHPWADLGHVLVNVKEFIFVQ